MAPAVTLQRPPNEQSDDLVANRPSESAIEAANSGTLAEEMRAGPGEARASLDLILIVDDDPALLSMVSELLTLEGYKVTTAGDGAGALRAIQRDPPSLILLDMRMPLMNGWQFANVLRERNSKIPLVVMTAARDARAWAEEIGARAFIEKPFDIEWLLTVIQRILEEEQRAK